MFEREPAGGHDAGAVRDGGPRRSRAEVSGCSEGGRGGWERNGPRSTPKLLEILVCPLTKEPLRYDAERQELISDKAKLAFPIRDGIPIMLPDEARPLEEGEAR